MSEKQIIRLETQHARAFAKQCIDRVPEDYVCTIQKKTRSLDQNSRLWAMLTDVSNQVEWYGRKLSPENWKHIFTAALKKQDVVPNLDGNGFVVLGQSTSKMTVSEMRDLQELMSAFAAERGVKFRDTRYEDYRYRDTEFVA